MYTEDEKNLAHRIKLHPLTDHPTLRQSPGGWGAFHHYAVMALQFSSCTKATASWLPMAHRQPFSVKVRSAGISAFRLSMVVSSIS